MSLPTGRLWVNPEGVIATGEAYAQQVELYEQYVTQLASLRDRYGKAWGDDDMGKAFSEKFLKGLDNLDSLVGGVKGTLNYVAEGLRASGQMYRDVDEGAREAGEKMARDFDENLSGQPLARRAMLAKEQPAFVSGEITAKEPLLPAYTSEQPAMLQPAMRVKGMTYNPGENPEGEGDGQEGFTATKSMVVGERVQGRTPLQPMMAGELRRGAVVGRDEDPAVEGESPRVFMASKRMDALEPTRGLLPLEQGVLTEREPLTPLLPMKQGVRVQGELLTPLEPTQGTMPMQRGVLAQGELITPGEVTEPVETVARVQPALKAEPMMPLEPTESVARIQPALLGEPMIAREAALPLQPTSSFAAMTPAMPAISSYMSAPEYSTAYVGGEPLPEGYRLQALNPFEDGNTRVDANLYESVTPLAGTPVTTPDGQVLNPGDRQFFVVKDNPAVDPTAPGYQPLVLSYSADGTPTPLI